MTNGGTTVEVTLTSHFAGNKVTRLDFELAEEMNEQYDRCLSSYKMHPRFTAGEWASIKIAVGALTFAIVARRLLTGSKYEQREQRAENFPVMPADLAKVNLPSTQAAVSNIPVSLARANSNKYYESRSESSPVPGM